ncbi:MAG: AAA family ATPase [Nitrospirae bacterium]|nr:AAA family ATPase [Magnetococcales bacterium]HAT51555.1 AAA family ATPase [Alphaproteobacteria bacterium]
MKISRIRLENFKRFENLEIPIRNNLTNDVADQFLILGDNGTGKTTVLQSIALCLSRIAEKVQIVSDLDWQGWVPGRYERWGTPIVELDIHFSDDEIKATQDAAESWNRNISRHPGGNDFIKPGDAKQVTVRLHGGYYAIVEGGKENIFQFRGRFYASQLVKIGAAGARALFPRLPGIFWFDQYRNLTSPRPDQREKGRSHYENDEDAQTSRRNDQYSIGVSRLRKHLNGWWMNRQVADGERDWLMELENSYKKVFPGRSFSRPEPMFRGGTPTPEDYFFCLSDGHRTYDIEEMSAGEQSIFPILYEFVRMQIRNSIVLIDEIDLNLHPPLAQALLAALPTIGPNCQFLLTTHSEAISSLVSPEETYRLPGGRLCL